MNKIIEELLDKGFSLTLYKDQHQEICYSLDGFYKSSGIILRSIENGMMAWSRYDRMNEINEFKDLVYLNYDWWQGSKDRFEGWNSPEKEWLPYLIEEGLVKKVEETLTTYI